MDAKLKVIGGKANKGSISLKLPTVIGRSRKAGLTIAHPMISRKHCKLFEADGLLMVHDLDSLNGTIIDEKPVKESPLPPNAEFSIGPLTFRAEYKYSGDLSALPEAVLSDKPAPQPDQQESWSDTPEQISLDQMTETVSPSEQAAVELSFLDDVQGDQSEAVAEPPTPTEEEEPVVAPSPPAESSKPAVPKKKPKGLASMLKGASKKNGEKKTKKPSAPPVDQPPTEKKPAAVPVAKQSATKEADFPLAPEVESKPVPSQASPDKPADEEFDIDSFLDGLN